VSELQNSHRASGLDKEPKLKKMDMRFGAWNVRSLYRTGLFRTLRSVVEEVSKYKLGLVGVQEVK
jgi:hypothetical protein